MYRLVKMFDKSVMAADEDIERFHFNNDGTVFAVETNKAVYTLEKI